MGTARTLLSSQSTSTITKMSVLHLHGRKTSGRALLYIQPQRITHAKPQDQSLLTPVIEHVKSVDLLRSRKVSYPWTGETQFRVTPAACGNSVFRTSARILVPVNDMNPMAIADSGASHVILPQSALFDSKSAKPVNLRLAAAEVQAVEAHREIFAEHFTIPLCPLGRVIRKLQLGTRPTSPLRDFGCFNSSAKPETFSASILETAVLGSYCRRTGLEDGSESRGEGASSVPRQDKVQFAPPEFQCYKNTVKPRSTFAD